MRIGAFLNRPPIFDDELARALQAFAKRGLSLFDGVQDIVHWLSGEVALSVR